MSGRLYTEDYRSVPPPRGTDQPTLAGRSPFQKIAGVFPFSMRPGTTFL